MGDAGYFGQSSKEWGIVVAIGLFAHYYRFFLKRTLISRFDY